MHKKSSTTPKEYVRYRKDKNRKVRMEHDLVWEEHYGHIPDGMQVHRKDFNKKNNNIENLQLVTPVEHKRIHSGCVVKEKLWYKPCKICGEFKPCTEQYWYFSRGWINGRICKQCYIKKVCKERKVREQNGWKRKDYRKKNESF